VEVYVLGLGGGISISYHKGTLEVPGRLGIGLGAGVSVDPFGTPSIHLKNCGSGAIARTSAKAALGLGAGPGGIAASGSVASGNALTDKVGGGFREVHTELGCEKPNFSARAAAS